MGGCQTQVVSTCPHVHRCHIFGYPYMFSKFLIGYLFCYNIKCFLTLETFKGDCQTQEVSIYPLCSYTPFHLDMPSIFSQFEQGIFILLFYKMFSYFRGSHGGLSDLGGVHIHPCSQTPYIWTPLYVQQILIGYLFCYNIKMFSYFRDCQWGLSDLGGIHMPPIFKHPPYFRTPPLYFRKFEQGIYFVIL